MRVIILAAGRGTRLGRYGGDRPKGMLDFLGKPLLGRQMEALHSAGLHDIVMVRGYGANRITFQGVRFLENPDFDTTNMVATLMAARHEMLSAQDGVLVAYSDIIYERRLVERLLAAQGADVQVLVDDDWREYWQARSDTWEADVESLVHDDMGRITEIGTPKCELSRALARYVGLVKFSTRGAEEFVRAFDENSDRFWTSETPWRHSASFRRAFMTCMLQELIDRGVSVQAVPVQRGWLEFDTEQDYERAISWAEDGSLRRFFRSAVRRVATTQRAVQIGEGDRRDQLEQSYSRFFEQSGLLLVPIPNVLQTPSTWAAELGVEGIVLTGGGDVGPELYDGNFVSSGDYAPDRDATEQNLVEIAIHQRLPVLGICRGAQFLNAFFGGRIRSIDGHVGRSHGVRLELPEGCELRTRVNSYHRMGLHPAGLGTGLIPFAMADDETVEGFRHCSLPIVGLLWHPERPGSDPDLDHRLVASFRERRWFWE